MTRPLLLATAALVLAVPAGADPLLPGGWLGEHFEPSGLPSLPLVLPSQPPPRASAAPAPEGPDATLASRMDRVASRSGARVHAPGLHWLGFFANGTELTIPRNGVGLDVRGGAYLQLLRNLTLRGSYRVFDYDRVENDNTLDTDDHGPLFGLSLSF